MKRKEYKTIKFEVNKRFYVEVTKEEELTEFYLCAKGYGIKMNMFGLYNKDILPIEYERFIETNANDYIDIYINEYMKE